METSAQIIFRYCVGDRDSYPLERRVLNALILSSCLLATVLVFEAIVFGYRKALVLSIVAASIFWSIYFFSKKARQRDSPLWIYLIFSGLVVLADRFFVGGNAGLALLVLVAISGAIPLITRKEQLKTAATLLLLFFVIICALTVIYWHDLPVQTPSRVNLLVQVLEAGILMSCLFSVTYLAIGSYRHEKSQVSSLNDELLKQERLATLGRLTATVSHELRNPLGTIKSALFTIDDCIELNELQRASRPLELAERNINRCVNIIEELNEYAREKNLDISETNMNDWLKSIVDEITIPDSIQIEHDFSCDIKVCFDQEKLRQVLINLINNAVHALQDKNSTDKKLLITCQVYDEQYEISVSDNGIGMSDEVKDKMFEPLFSTKGFGLGLGMVIVKKIVEQHQGRIHIESQVGEGSTITIRLPIALNG